MISAKRPSVYGKLQISNCCAEIKKIWYSRNHEPDDPAIVEILDFDYETNEHVEKIIDARKIATFLLHELTDKEREVFFMRFIEEKTQKHIGDFLGITGNRVAQIEAKAWRKIKKVSYSYRNNTPFYEVKNFEKGFQ